MPNITERQTRIKQANRSKNQGATLAGYGALGYTTNWALRGGRTEADAARTYRAHRLLMGGRPATEQVKAAGSAAKGLVSRNRISALSAGAVGMGAGMMAHGSAKRRYNEAKISQQRKENEKKAVSKALDVSPAFTEDSAIAKANPSRLLRFQGKVNKLPSKPGPQHVRAGRLNIARAQNAEPRSYDGTTIAQRKLFEKNRELYFARDKAKRALQPPARKKGDVSKAFADDFTIGKALGSKALAESARLQRISRTMDGPIWPSKTKGNIRRVVARNRLKTYQGVTDNEFNLYLKGSKKANQRRSSGG